MNLTPIPREGYRVGLPTGGRWREVINTDAEQYGGSGMGNFGGVEAEDAAVARPGALGGDDAAAAGRVVVRP